MNKKVKYSLIILWILFLIWQSYAVYIDMYNFKQLEKVKTLLNKKYNVELSFKDIVDFNHQYNQNIKPIWNCYYLSSYNNKEKYMFWFKLESLIYTYTYWTKYFSYPKYDIPYWHLCLMWKWCFDANKEDYIKVISNKCWWHLSWYLFKDNNKNGIKDKWELWLEWVGILLRWTAVRVDKTWYYSFTDLSEWEYEIVPKYYKNDYYITSPKEKEYNIYLKKWENIQDLNFWVE